MVNTETSLAEAIGEWDGKSASDIERIYAAFHRASDFEISLAGLMYEDELQKGASWLFKHHIRNGHKPDGKVSARLFRSLDRLSHWETRLHVLQALHELEIPAKHKDRIYLFLREGLGSGKTLVKAWAYSGLAVLASQHHEYHDEASRLLSTASGKESAGSVRVRIRKALETLSG